MRERWHEKSTMKETPEIREEKKKKKKKKKYKKTRRRKRMKREYMEPVCAPSR